MSASNSPPATLIPAQPATLVVGEQRVPIDEWPLARFVEERRSVEVWQDGDVLVVGPKKRTVAGLVVRTLFLSGIVPAATAFVLQVPWWLSILIGIAVLAVVLLFIRMQLSSLRWLRFDRAAGLLVIERRIGFRRKPRVDSTQSLRTIQAIQLLYSGRHSITEPQGTGEQQHTSIREFYGYELNLVLDDAATPRINLISQADWQWVRQTEQTLGEFLGVPVIDKLDHGG